MNLPGNCIEVNFNIHFRCCFFNSDCLQSYTTPIFYFDTKRSTLVPANFMQTSVCFVHFQTLSCRWKFKELSAMCWFFVAFLCHYSPMHCVLFRHDKIIPHTRHLMSTSLMPYCHQQSVPSLSSDSGILGLWIKTHSAEILRNIPIASMPSLRPPCSRAPSWFETSIFHFEFYSDATFDLIPYIAYNLKLNNESLKQR